MKSFLLASFVGFAACGALAACASGDDKKTSGDRQATETNVMPAPCAKNEDCPEGIACEFPNGPDEQGFCDVDERRADGSASVAAPAPCSSDGDCPEGIACAHLDGPDSPGFCDVDETVVGGGPTSSAAPAPCVEQTDCPAGIACVHPNGTDGPGFCDVREHIAP